MSQNPEILRLPDDAESKALIIQTLQEKRTKYRQRWNKVWSQYKKGNPPDLEKTDPSKLIEEARTNFFLADALIKFTLCSILIVSEQVNIYWFFGTFSELSIFIVPETGDNLIRNAIEVMRHKYLGNIDSVPDETEDANE